MYLLEIVRFSNLFNVRCSTTLHNEYTGFLVSHPYHGLLV